MDKYKNFSIEDFLQDEFFNRWVKEQLPDDNEVWENWLECNEGMAEIIDESRNVILAFNAPASHLPHDFYEKLKNRIDTTISKGRNNTTTTFFGTNWLKIAAVFAALIIAAKLLFPSEPGTNYLTYESKYAETKKIVLPDGSEIVLNANSFVKYRDSGNNKNREVWLEGEAFFKVNHVEDEHGAAEKFVVHTKDLNVEVLGTEFNVNTAEGSETQVLLTKGKVRLSINEPGNRIVNMLPQEQVRYNKKTKDFTANKVKPELYTAWKEHRFILEKTTLNEVCRNLKRYYGKTVSVQDPEMLQERLSGILELQDEETLIKTLSVLLGVQVEKTKHQIIIHSK